MALMSACFEESVRLLSANGPHDIDLKTYRDYLTNTLSSSILKKYSSERTS